MGHFISGCHLRQSEMISKLAKSSLLVLVCLHEVLGHGFMYFPTSWNSRNEVVPCKGLKGAKFGYTYPLPEVVCDKNSDTERCSPSALNNGWTTDWFTNFTFVPGTGLSMSEEMYSTGRVWIKVEGEKRYNPWAQPGTAPIYGEGCGLNGGNPNGCQGDYEDSNPFGTCCGGSPTNGWGFKDFVQIPENIEPGAYVMSFRWDSQKNSTN